MIIKSTNVRTSSKSRAIVHHLVGKTDENDSIEVLFGNRGDVDDAFTNAELSNKKYGVKHFIISNLEEMTNEQFYQSIDAIGKEFGFTRENVKLAVIHGKDHHHGDGRHCHFLVETINPENNRNFDFKNYQQRQELVSRTLEMDNGFQLNKGRHNKYVYSRLSESNPQCAEKMAHLCEGRLERKTISEKQIENLRRRGSNPFQMKKELKELWASSSGDFDKFAEQLTASGYSIEQGRKTLIINDRDGKFITGVKNVLNVNDKELTTILETSESYKKTIASHGNEGPKDATLPPGGIADATPLKPTEKPQEAPEQPKATTEATNQAQNQEQAQKADLGGPAILSEAVKGVATESMSQAEKQAVHDENKRQQELDESLRKQASEQKKFADFLNEISDDIEAKRKHKKNFDEFIKLEISENEKILNEKHPTLKHLDKKEIRSFLYKNFKTELADLKEQKEKLFTLRKEIRAHDKNDGIFKIYHEYKSTSKKKIEKENNTQIKLKASFVIDNMKYKLGLSKTEPNEEDYLSQHQKHTRASNAMKDEYKKLLASYESNVKAINAIADLKYMQRENKLHDFYNRPEVQEARNYIMKLERVRDLSVDDMTDSEKTKYDMHIEKCDIEGLSKLIYEKNKRILEEEKKRDRENSISVDNDNDEFVDDKEIEKNLYRKKKNTLSR